MQQNVAALDDSERENPLKFLLRGGNSGGNELFIEFYEMLEMSSTY
jgi:hypothetical protein